MDLKEIQKRNYKATRRRGLITNHTSEIDFLKKLKEEVNEFADDYADNEAADVILVVLAYAEHFNIDIKKALEEKTLFNETRKD